MLENIKLHTRALELINEDMENNKVHHKRREKLSKLSSGFLVSIFEISNDHEFIKMVAERAVEIFTGSEKKEVKEQKCPHIMGVIYGCEENMEISQEKLTAAYWKYHPGKYKKLSAEKAMLEKETEKIKAEEEAAREKEERKTEAIRKEIEAAEKKWDTARHRSIRLNFFQKKEKKRLEEEMQEAFVLKHNLEEKLKLREKEVEKNINKIIKEWAKNDTELCDRIDNIEMELERNHYPFEDDFIEMFERKIRKVEDNFGKK
jgi:ATP-dependent Lon protease